MWRRATFPLLFVLTAAAVAGWFLDGPAEALDPPCVSEVTVILAVGVPRRATCSAERHLTVGPVIGEPPAVVIVCACAAPQTTLVPSTAPVF